MSIFNYLLNEISWLPYSVREVLEPTLLIAMVVLGIATIVVVLMQKGTSDNIGTISGESETYLGKNKSQDKEKMLKLITLILGALLVIVSILFFLIQIK